MIIINFIFIIITYFYYHYHYHRHYHYIRNGKRIEWSTIHIPNRTFLVRFGGISGEFGRAMVRILARRKI